VRDFIQHLVNLRRTTRSVLGSHWFLWTEFVLFSGIDVFLDYLEPKVLDAEHGDDDNQNHRDTQNAMAAIEEKFKEQFPGIEKDGTVDFLQLQRRIVAAVNE